MRSLGFRLLLVSLVSTALALIATTFVLSSLFYSYFEDRVVGELEQHLEQLTTNLTLGPAGNIAVAPLLDRRFEQPFSGLYWQVEETGGTAILSRSLWGISIEVTPETPPGVRFKVESVSPVGSGLLVVGWPVLLGDEGAQRTVTLSVATDHEIVSKTAREFRTFLIRWLALMFGGLLVAAWAQVRIGLSPLKLLRGHIEKIRAGTETRLTGRFPSEVKPLVDEVNSLLTLHERSLSSARARAGDLAHGLKTPLTIMRAHAQDLALDGQKERAEEIETQIASMHHFIERELARVDTTISAIAPVDAARIIERMVTGVMKLPGGVALNWKIDVPADLKTPFGEHDLGELLGNILDNARKWATRSVEVSAANTDAGGGWIRVADDGPGIPDEMRDAVLKRGARADATTAGTGLGLAISTDLVAQVDGRLEMSKPEGGGLEICVCWDD